MDYIKDLIAYKHNGVDDEYADKYNDVPHLEVVFETEDRVGTTVEDLLVIAVARLADTSRHAPSRENSLAITKIEEALLWLGYQSATVEYRKSEEVKEK